MPTGRRPNNITEEVEARIYRLASLRATQDEIAALLSLPLGRVRRIVNHPLARQVIASLRKQLIGGAK